MAITISGSGITSANIADGTIVNADVADVAASKLTGALPAIDGSALTGMAGGKVLQVVSTPKTDTFSTTSSSFVDITGLSVSITPSASSSKILVTYSMFAQNSTSGNIVYSRVLRGSTAIHQGDTGYTYRASAASNGYEWEVNSHSIEFLDSPATTSAQTYKVQLATPAGTAIIGEGGFPSVSVATPCSITVMEIGA